jgi:hypothetical protein
MHDYATVRDRRDGSRPSISSITQLKLSTELRPPALVQIEKNIQIPEPSLMERVKIEIGMHIEKTSGPTLVKPPPVKLGVYENALSGYPT